MHLKTTPIYYVKYRNEESEDKPLRELINIEGVARVTTKEERRVNMRNVTMEHCFENKETRETIRRRKMPRWLIWTFKEGRENYMKGNIYLKTTTKG